MFFRQFWELPLPLPSWELMQTTVKDGCNFGGMEQAVFWQNAQGILHERGRRGEAVLAGGMAWGRKGVLVSQMRHLPACFYDGDIFDKNTAAIVPHDPAHLSAIWAFCSSPEYNTAVRQIDRKLNVTNNTLVKVPFDLEHWQRIAAERYPNGLPEPESDDPTQWLFHGHPCHAAPGTELHVALARLAGYRWPAESDPDMRLSAQARARVEAVAALPPADADGLLPLVPVLGDRALADRLRAWCAATWGAAWQPGTEAALVQSACESAGDRPPRQLSLDAWLRSHAARQHCKLFGDRPFLWWITDGRTDGFACVVHYHRLDRATLERLAWHALGDWIARLGDDPRAEAARVLQSKLAAILEGETPLDIFVRWKGLDQQPLGWEPDLDDGVRLNVRPFVKADVLAHEPNVHWRVDRGRDVPSSPWYARFNGERRNDHHTTLTEKRAARTMADRAA